MALLIKDRDYFTEVIKSKTMHQHISKSVFFIAACSLCLASSVVGCSPRVAVEVPDKPITINLNVKIDHEVRIKVEKDLDNLIGKDKNLF